MKAHNFFQINELHIRELEELSPAYTLPENTYKSLIMAKIYNFSEKYFKQCVH